MKYRATQENVLITTSSAYFGSKTVLLVQNPPVKAQIKIIVPKTLTQLNTITSTHLLTKYLELKTKETKLQLVPLRVQKPTRFGLPEQKFLTPQIQHVPTVGI